MLEASGKKLNAKECLMRNQITGNWLHAGYHLTTSIAAPALLSLSFAFAALGWFAGILCLTHILFIQSHILGVGALDIGRQSPPPIQRNGQRHFLYLIYHPNGPIKQYEFIIIFGIVMLFLSQMPSFHSLRDINLLSLILCLVYSLCVVGGSIHAGHSKLNVEKDYAFPGRSASKVFGAFNSVATLSPPVSGKMFKGLCICYTVVISTFFSVAVSGYWAFGNRAAGNIFNSFAPAGEPSLVPNWLLFTANTCVLLQLFAVSLGKSGDASNGRFSLRNLRPRLFVRSVYVSVATVIASMLPFFGDIGGVIGAFWFHAFRLRFLCSFIQHGVQAFKDEFDILANTS